VATKVQKIIEINKKLVLKMENASNTRVAREIRSYALEHGGAEVVPVRWEQVDGKTWVRKQ